jgi:undecaprenyl-diphosphatase
MLSFTQALILGLIQGITELFPISSLGHSVIFPALFGWGIDQQDPFFLSFLVATHLATALVLLGFFARDWYAIITATLRSLVTRRLDTIEARLGWLIVVSTIPAGLLGLLFEHKFQMLFAAPMFAAFFLICNGFLLLGAELLRRKAAEMSGGDERLAKLSWREAILIGALQCLALFPGFSRTGATLSGGLAVKLSHEDAARYSFLLATPIILAAAVLKLPKLLVAAETSTLVPLFAGAIAAAIAAYFSVRFLMHYFKTKTLTPFAIYCLVFGFSAVLLLR